MFKIGDKVRFTTDEPSYCAVYFDGVLTVVSDPYDDDDGLNIEVSYENCPEWSGITQTVLCSELELVR